MPFLLGKVLNAFLLDHVDVDIELLTRMNSVRRRTSAYGAAFVPRMSAEAHRRGALSLPQHRCLAVRPSEDIGRLAANT